MSKGGKTGGTRCATGGRLVNGRMHGLRTPSEGINQRNLKIWANVADKICFGRT